jgi:hypothetical protein
MKKLYTVTVEFEYAVVAESEFEAESWVDMEMRNLSGMDLCPEVRELPTIKGKPILPDGWDEDSLVYGDEELTLIEAFKKYGKKEE